MFLTGLEAVLTAALAVLAGVVIWLIVRSRKRGEGTAAVLENGLQEFVSLLNASAHGGDIAQVASRVSNMMIDRFGCELIIFMRKKRGNLICNYSHGLEHFNRRDFRMPYSRQIFESVRESYQPRPISELASHLPSRIKTELEHIGADLFFPVFWHDNLYGVYFIRSNDCLRSGSCVGRLAVLAQCLSSAYHIKWFETKREALIRNIEDLKDKLEKAAAPVNGQASILHLVKQLEPDALVHKILQVVREELGLGRAVYLYRDRSGRTGLKLVKSGSKGPIETPSADSFEELMSALNKEDAACLGKLRLSGDASDRLIKQLKNFGVEFLTSFSLSERQEGVLAFSGDKNVLADKRLSIHRDQAAQLLELADSYRQVEEMSFTDDLTGLANKRYLLKRLDEEVARASRYNRCLSLILFDLDELKLVNDRHGHQAGDQVLRQLGQVLKQSIRSIDIVARYGGDEFCVVMPEADAVMAHKFMLRLQRNIADHRFHADGVGGFSCTASLGGAVFPDNGDDRDSLIYAADMALLKAKEAGRNLALLADSSPADS